DRARIERPGDRWTHDRRGRRDIRAVNLRLITSRDLRDPQSLVEPVQLLILQNLYRNMQSPFNVMTNAIKIPGVRTDERGKVILLALHNVAVTAVTIAGKSVRDGYFLSRFDKSALPLMMCAIAVAVATIVPLYRRLASRYAPEVLLPGTALLFAVSLFLIHFKLEGWTIPLLYVWMEVITVLTILQFWLAAWGVFDARRATRLFPIVGGGGSWA